MARMYPSNLPATVHDDPKRSAEVAVYEACQRTLPDDFHVFYSFCWVAKLRDGRALDGEADFVIAHPDKGILVAEVKGGRISYNGKTGQWTSTDRDGVSHPIDPVSQARRAKFSLLDRLKATPAWGGRWIDIGHCVVFPHCGAPGRTLTGDLPRDILVCGDDFERLREKIDSVFGYWTLQSRVTPISSNGIRTLAELIAPCFELRMPLGIALREEDRRILQLTEEQFNLLEMLKWNPRVAVSGGAGTGKTVLAVEKAKRLANEGRRTLLVCFNRPLAEFMSLSVGKQKDLSVQSFHQLCGTLASRAGVILGSIEEESLSRRFEEELPAAMIDAIAENPDEQFDAIVVDEGQDFPQAWWHALEWANKDGESGTLYVFYDDNQRIYRRRLSLPRGMVPAVLTRNLRNTKSIFDCGRSFYKGTAMTAGGPDGREPELVEASGDQARLKAVSRLLHRLVRDEGIAPRDIAVLSGRRLSDTCIAKYDRIGAFAMTTSSEDNEDRVHLGTVQRFKGLERPVVLITEIDDVKDKDEVLYVGLTRARVHLIVVAERETLELVKRREG